MEHPRLAGGIVVKFLTHLACPFCILVSFMIYQLFGSFLVSTIARLINSGLEGWLLIMLIEVGL